MAAMTGAVVGPQIPEALRVTADEMAAYKAQNDKLAAKYPSLALVLKDPDAFRDSTKAKFAAQKMAAPENPYGFDFSDYGLPVMQDFQKALEAEIDKVEGALKELNDGEWSWVPSFLSGHDAAVKEHETGLALLNALKTEVEGHLEKGSIDYKRTQELGFFVARALGHFDMDQIGLRDRTLLKADRYMQGYESLSIEEELARYKANDFSVFQKESPVEGFKLVHQSFEDAFFNPDAMEMVSLPTCEHLGPGVFMRMSSYDMFVMGVAAEPEAADGFVRPGGDFWLHDVRHSSSIFGKRKMYEMEHGLSELQQHKLQKKIDLWKTELNAERKKVPSKELRYAIGFFMFNYHHDRGLPMVPSSYHKEKVDHVPRLLYAMLQVSDQPIGFEKPMETLTAAYDWLQDFWLSRLPEEQAIIDGDKPI